MIRTVSITPAIAATAVSLPSSFPGDPADRLIYATAIEHGLRLVTKDVKLRSHPHPRPIAIW
jgi:PIN domain nuclease of toxin-antitoxin system